MCVILDRYLVERGRRSKLSSGEEEERQARYNTHTHDKAHIRTTVRVCVAEIYVVSFVLAITMPV